MVKEKIIAIIPAYNEEENIVSVIGEIREYGKDLDIVVINDGSSDSTPDRARNMGVTVLDLPYNLGIGGAVQAGYIYARDNDYGIAIQIDADGQHDPSWAPRLIAPILQGEADMVIGSRFLKESGEFKSTFSRRIGIRFFSFFISMVTGLRITDPTSGFRACNRRIINLFAKSYPQDYPEPESLVMLSRRKYKIKEIPVKMRKRTYGKSSIGFISAFYYMIKVTIAILIDYMRGMNDEEQI